MQNSYSKVHISMRLNVAGNSLKNVSRKYINGPIFISINILLINETKIVPICLFIGLTFCLECLTDATFINVN